MNFEDLIGQTLDEKYRIERQLGRGGMGTVYLATHLGTERPVAVKVIAPQFMERPEFVERFRREARAAGRLRHPNVVDVTDFGFAETPEGRVAYLVMEYLDGCTLGEILEEERNLPVSWTLDILEQVCSAVQEAHDQGIIHRDLKPDNIWLEPNQRGGYTVKVLDFGIAKLETQSNGDGADQELHITAAPTFVGSASLTVADLANSTAIHDSISPTAIFGTGTIADAPGVLEAATVIQPAIDEPAIARDQETVGTKLIAPEPYTDTDRAAESSGENTLATKALTRIGAVLGTPIYMSPEQCRGEKLDARSDIYSLGVIAYQMLSGDPPFKGDFSKVMDSHRLDTPPPLKVKGIRRKLRREIMAALSKDPNDRPQTAESFATRLRSRSEGIFGLLRRAGMIYTEHITKFLGLSALFHIPMMIFTVVLIILNFMKVGGSMDTRVASALISVTVASLTVISAFCAYLIIGTITWVVTQSLAVPLRPIRIREALKEARKKWRTFAGTGILSTVLSIVIGVLTCGVGFLVLSVLWSLVGPVVMMEGLKGRKALKRSKDLVKRSLVTATAAVAIMFLIPSLSAGMISFVVNVTDRAISTQPEDIEAGGETQVTTENEPAPNAANDKKETVVQFELGDDPVFRIKDDGSGVQQRLRHAIRESLVQLLLLPLQILVTSITAIIVALLYLKTRQAGGEPLQEFLAGFEETDQPRKKWQERVQRRLLQSGRVSSGSGSRS
jgi:serine/threonine protein kinase